MKRQSGFTLIEMVAVIIILAIMAATALPRFANLSAEARQSSIEGLAGGLRSAVALAKSKWLVANSADVPSVDLNGTAVSVVHSASTGSSVANFGNLLANDGAGTHGIFYALEAATGYTSQILGDGSGAVFWPTGVANSTTCSAAYASATGIVTVTASVAGCG